MIKEAIVLAGGFGTRLQSIVSEVPKPMAPVAGKPFLKFVLDYLKEHHITHVVLAVGHKKEFIIEYFGGLYKDMKVSYSKENDPLGTGGAIKQALEKLKGDQFFVLNGDTFFNVNLEELYIQHTAHQAAISIALRKMTNFNRYGTVEINEEGKVIAFNEKKYVREGLINGGTYILHKDLFLKRLPKKFSFEKEILEREFKKGKIYGTTFQEYFIDIGIPDDYEKAKNDFTRPAFK